MSKFQSRELQPDFHKIHQSLELALAEVDSEEINATLHTFNHHQVRVFIVIGLDSLTMLIRKKSFAITGICGNTKSKKARLLCQNQSSYLPPFTIASRTKSQEEAPI